MLLNTWKHHAGMLRQRIADTTAAGPGALAGMARGLIVMGTELMDLYLGALTPRAIGEGVLDRLRTDGHATPDAFRAWLAGNRGYRVITLPADRTDWVLRMGEEGGRWVHVHPARRAPRTCRVKASMLKTAVMAIAHAAAHGGDPRDVTLVNAVRRDYLGLAPLGRDLAGDQGIGHVIVLLHDGEGD